MRSGGNAFTLTSEHRPCDRPRRTRRGQQRTVRRGTQRSARQKFRTAAHHAAAACTPGSRITRPQRPRRDANSAPIVRTIDGAIGRGFRSDIDSNTAMVSAMEEDGLKCQEQLAPPLPPHRAVAVILVPRRDTRVCAAGTALREPAILKRYLSAASTAVAPLSRKKNVISRRGRSRRVAARARRCGRRRAEAASLRKADEMLGNSRSDSGPRGEEIAQSAECRRKRFQRHLELMTAARDDQRAVPGTHDLR